MKGIKIFILLFTFAFIFACSQSKDDVIIKAGSSKLTKQDLQEDLKSFPPQTKAFLSSPEGLNRLKDELIKREVLYEEAKKKGAEVEANNKIEIRAYETPLHHRVVRRFIRACENLNLPCNIHSTFGGSDQNNFSLHGITGLVIACGMNEVHSLREYSNINELEKCVKLVMELIKGGEVKE